MTESKELAPVRRTSPTRNMPAYSHDKNRPYVGDPWQKQEHETNRAFTAFQDFLELDPEVRTIKAAMTTYYDRNEQKFQQNYGIWSRKHRWIERADAWDTYIANKKIASMKRQRIKSAEKHAKQMADMQEVSMLPVNELRERLREQGGQLAIIADLDEVSLLKLANAMGRDLPMYQKAEREALGSVEGTSIEPAKLAAKGDLLRRLMASKGTAVVAERMTLLSTETIEAEETG